MVSQIEVVIVNLSKSHILILSNNYIYLSQI